ncbi:MAG: hypothetical protein ACPHUF_14565, partial [Gammaproteobacteria bacterium]
FKLTFRVLEGEHEGRQFWHDVWLTAAALPMAKHDLAKLGIRAMICGTLASYLSATIAGIMYGDGASNEQGASIMPFVLMAFAISVIVFFNRRAGATASSMANGL